MHCVDVATEAHMNTGKTLTVIGFPHIFSSTLLKNVNNTMMKYHKQVPEHKQRQMVQ